MKTPRLKLVGIASAVTYKFRGFRGLEPLSGWADCTVNDETGALMITSDWGDWSYTWGHLNFGASKNLTEFITICGVDYLADKLSGGTRASKEFDGAATTKQLKAELRVMRKSCDISKDVYESCLSQLSHMASPCSEERYADQVSQLVGDKDVAIFDEPWYFYQYKDKNEYVVLLRSILPALKLACRKSRTQRNKMMVQQAPVTESSNG